MIVLFFSVDVSTKLEFRGTERHPGIHPVKDAGGGRRQAATAEAGLAFRQFQGRSSSMRLAG
jgi:hypothetical protein